MTAHYTYDKQADRDILAAGSVYEGVTFETCTDIEDELLVLAQLAQQRTALRITITDSELVARLAVLHLLFNHITACEQADI